MTRTEAAAGRPRRAGRAGRRRRRRPRRAARGRAPSAARRCRDLRRRGRPTRDGPRCSLGGCVAGRATPDTMARSTPSRTATARPGSPPAYADDGDPAVGRGDVGPGRDARGRAGRVGRVDAPEAQRLGVGGDLAVDGRLTCSRVDEPGPVEVGRPGVVAFEPLEATGHGQLSQVLAEPGGDDAHDGTLVDERPDPTRRHGTPSDRDDEAPGQVEHDRQRRLHAPRAGRRGNSGAEPLEPTAGRRELGPSRRGGSLAGRRGELGGRSPPRVQISHSSSPSGSVGAGSAVGSVAPTMPAATVRPSWASMSRNEPARRETE